MGKITMRLFIAINFNESTRNELIALRDNLKHNSTKGRFTLDENLHLTLIFLGECDSGQKDTAIAVMESVSFEPFFIEVDRIGRFKRNGSDLWWAGVEESKQLLQLQQDLADKLRFTGFSVEKRKHNPHITLGREIITTEKDRSTLSFGETVMQIDLMESTWISRKLTYVPVYGRKGTPI